MMEEKAKELPKSWTETELRNLIVFAIGGDWGKSPEHQDKEYEEVFCIRGTEFRNWHQDKGSTAVLRKIKANSLKKRHLKKGDILLEISGGGPEQPVGRIELIDQSVLSINPTTPKICTNFLRMLRLTGHISPDYLTYYLKFFYSTGEVVKYQAGSNNLRNLKFDDYISQSIPLAPLNEQDRIVDKIDLLFSDLDKGEENLRKAQKLIASYRQSVLKAAVTGELTKDWREANKDRLESGEELLERILKQRHEQWEGRGKYKEPGKLDTSKLPILPEGWVWCTLDSVIRAIITGPFGSSLHKSEYINNGIPLINPINIQAQKIIPDQNVTVSLENQKRLERFNVQMGDVVMGRRGEMGRCAPVTSTEDGWLCGTGSLILRPINLVTSHFLSTYISSAQTRQYLEENCVGTTMKNLNQKVLTSIILAIPSVDEQREVINRLEEINAQIDALESWCKMELNRSITLRQSILKDAFAGQLVPQNENDEPASELLERIKAESATMLSPKKSRSNSKAIK